MNNDLISRESLRKAFHGRIYYFDKSSWDEANALIDNAPTVSDRYDEGFRDGYAQYINDKEERKENNRLFQKGGAE